METEQSKNIKVSGCDSEQPPSFGSIGWANYILREGIEVLKDWNRESGSRVLEVLCKIDLLEDQGFWWQASRLRNWLHYYWYDLRPKADSERSERASI